MNFKRFPRSAQLSQIRDTLSIHPYYQARYIARYLAKVKMALHSVFGYKIGTL
jgi:hypothetical protein